MHARSLSEICVSISMYLLRYLMSWDETSGTPEQTRCVFDDSN